MNSEASQFRFSIRHLLVAVVLCAVALFAGQFWYNNLRSIPSGRAMQINEGMTKQEVLDMIGEPHRIGARDEWLYRVSGAGDLYILEFDENDVLTWVSF